MTSRTVNGFADVDDFAVCPRSYLPKLSDVLQLAMQHGPLRTSRGFSAGTRCYVFFHQKAARLVML